VLGQVDLLIALSKCRYVYLDLNLPVLSTLSRITHNQRVQINSINALSPAVCRRRVGEKEGRMID
jgi:hypothetical protein